MSTFFLSCGSPSSCVTSTLFNLALFRRASIKPEIIRTIARTINRIPIAPGKTEGPITTDPDAGGGKRKAKIVYVMEKTRTTIPEMIFLFK